MPKKHSITLYEVEDNGRYHEHWLATSFLDAAERAMSHARECGLKLDRVKVSSMVPPEDTGKGGLVYVVNDTRVFALIGSQVKEVGQAYAPAIHNHRIFDRCHAKQTVRGNGNVKARRIVVQVANP